MARYICQGTMKSGSGKVVGSATTPDGKNGVISVYLAGTDTAADVYAAETGGAHVNSVSTDEYGSWSFWVDTDDYSHTQLFKIKLSHINFITKTYDNIRVIFANLSGTVSDDAYAAGWNGVTDTAPSKNAVYDKIETVVASISDTAYAASWNGVTDVAPSKNAVYDKIEAIGSASVSDLAYTASWNGVTDVAPSKNTVYDKIEALTYSDVGAEQSGVSVLEADFNAHTILAADTDNTPLPITLAVSQLIGRKSTGGITALAKADVHTILNIEDGATKYPDTGEQAFLDADHTKLNGIEASADVTDATNVAAAGAVMDADFAAAHELMKGTGAGTHDQLTVAASRIVGRAAAGNIDDLTAAQVRTILEFTSPILDKTTPGAIGTTTPGNIYSNYLKMSGEASFVIQTHDDITGAQTINWQNGNKHKMKFGAGNVTFTFTAPHYACNLLFLVQQDSVGSRTITWPATVKWPGGVEPTLSTGALAIDIVSFFFSGSAYYSVASLDFS